MPSYNYAQTCASRTATNTKGSCGNGETYGFYANNIVNNVSEGSFYTISNASFVENTDGTARYTAVAISNDDSRVRWNIDMTFTGRTTSPPSGSPRTDACHNAGSDYYYYTGTSGTLTGTNLVAGAQLSLSRNGEAFQLGTGANLRDPNLFGASGWLNYTVNSQPNNASITIISGSQIDINIRLSGSPTACTTAPPPPPPASGCTATVTVDGSKITVNNIGGAHSEVNFLNGAWQVQQVCSSWGATACGNMTMYTAPSAGTYHVLVKTYSASWSVICNETVSVNVSVGGGTPPPSPCANQGGDSDGDGVCNNQDCQPNNPNISNPGDACNDGNANTTNDQIQSDCSCSGTSAPPPPPPTSGGCNATTSVSGSTITVNNLTGAFTEVNFLDSNWQSLSGCSTWGSNPCSATPSFNAPGAGTYYVLIKSYSSTWSVICNLTEVVTVGGAPPPPPAVCSITASVSNIQCNNNGTATQSDDTFTFDVTATLTNGGPWGFDIQGTNVSAIPSGSTATVNGGAISGGTRTFRVFDNDDFNCFTNITVTPPAPCSSGTPAFDCPALGANIGDACNDGNANTTNDQVQSDCTCSGTSAPPPPPAGGSCNASISVSGSTVSVNGLSGAFQQVIVADASWNTVFSCDSWGGTPCAAIPMFTAATAGTYHVTVKTYNSSWANICNIFETITLTGGNGNTGGCNNVTNGGQINGAESNCGGYDPGVIGSTSFPSGGSGAIEYLWLSSTSGCPTSLTQAISGATGATYNPGSISQTTWYRRCSRRAGCTSWFEGESNCIMKEVRTCNATVCATRQVFNSVSNCGSGVGYGFFAQDWIYGAGGLNNSYDFQNGSFVENTDGTARLTGTVINLSNANVQFALDVTFSGRTNNGNGKGNPECNITPQNDWYYYTTTTGTLTGQGAVAGALVNISRDGDPFQVGTGANLNDRWNFGASGWLLYTVVSQPTNASIQIQLGNRRLDINIRLSGNSAPCAPYTARQAANNKLDVAVRYDQVELGWTNDTGYKNDNFEIERSKDGNNWESIGTVESLSIDDTPNYYRSDDANPFEGFNYYRVKVTYLDGSEEYTETKRVTIADLEDFGIFPNPTQETVNVSLKGYEGKDIEIQVVNQLGRRVQSVRLINVTDSTYQLELNSVQNGIYSLWIFTEGRRPISKRMIVNKMY